MKFIDYKKCYHFNGFLPQDLSLRSLQYPNISHLGTRYDYKKGKDLTTCDTISNTKSLISF